MEKDKETDKGKDEVWYDGIKFINEHHRRNYEKVMESRAAYQAGEKLDLETMIAQMRKNSKD